MAILNKIKTNLKKHNIFVVLKKLSIKLTHVFVQNLFNKIFSSKYDKELKEIIKDHKEVVLLYPFFDYNMPNFQRFQQIAISLSKHYLVFYATPNNIYDSIYGFKKINDNLYLTNQYNKIINLENIHRNMIFVSTDGVSTLKDVQASLDRKDTVIYDYVDEIHPDIIGEVPKSVLDKHEFVMNNDDIIVLATANKLIEDVKKYRNKNVYLVTNGVKIEDFKVNENNFNDSKFIKMSNFKKNYKYILCYYGALAKWFDYDLIDFLAKDKNIGIVLIGVDYDSSLKKSKILVNENVLFLGPVNYYKLKYYANLSDILTIPFVKNEVTNATSPVKLFEYMALNKPIITTDLAECRKYKSVNIATSYENFHNLIFNFKFDEKLMYKEAIDNSWENKALYIQKILKDDVNI